MQQTKRLNRERPTAIASTASSGATLASIRSRPASTASIRRRVASGVDPASYRTSAHGRVDELDRRADLHRQHITVERGQVEQGTVQGVALGPGGAGLLPVLQVLHGAGHAAHRLGHALAGRALAERLAQRRPLRLVELLGDRGGLFLRRINQRAAAAKAGPSGHDCTGTAEHPPGGAAAAGSTRAAGPGRCAPARPGPRPAPGRVDPVARRALATAAAAARAA